ncbi:hypothetical protein PCASD_21747 [Puccinia coronata f. sp. avenae]|uniref:Uncharacterized protein n=1 Tax=Puccinia coronata f. sp. avenae TaxID=200324 RepID=A0A2N5T6I4_9BASI|nr:hypothetical protein PCASD_21747 [Puccinia coronata f. sp. avenae]
MHGTLPAVALGLSASFNIHPIASGIGPPNSVTYAMDNAASATDTSVIGTSGAHAAKKIIIAWRTEGTTVKTTRPTGHQEAR